MIIVQKTINQYFKLNDRACFTLSPRAYLAKVIDIILDTIFPLQQVPAPDRQSSPADPPSQLQSGHVAVSNQNRRVCLPGA